MKKFFVALFLLAGFLYQGTQAQVKVRLNVNIGSQPAWGPTGYDHAEFYYLPDQDCYYDVNGQQFVYFDNGRWIYTRTLPPRYGHADVYRNKYARYKGHPQHQEIIRDSKEEKYFASKDHPRHAEWERKHGHDDDHGHDD